MPSQPVCFLVSPIREPKSPERAEADRFRRYIVERALQKWDFKVVRGDDVADGNKITDEVLALIQQAEFCVINLTDYNPNVMFECGLRHGSTAPKIHMVRHDQANHLPFNLKDLGVIPYDLSSLEAADEAVERLQRYVGPLVEAGFESKGTPITLSTLNTSIESLSRKIQKLLDTPRDSVTPAFGGATSSETFLNDLMKPPKQLIMEALKHGDLDRAYSLLSKIKKTESVTDYVAVLIPLVSMGHGPSFESLDDKFNELLKDPSDVGEDEEKVFHLIAAAVSAFFQNSGEIEGSWGYLDGHVNRVLAAGLDNDTKAAVANRIGMYAWAVRDYTRCEKYTRMAAALKQEPAYWYNLCILYEHIKSDVKLQEALKTLSTMPDLDSDHLRILRNHGYDV